MLCNAVLVGFTIAFAETYVPGTGLSAAFPAAWAYNGLTVGLGELGACYALGMLLLYALPKIKYFRPMIPEAHLT